MVSSDLSCLSWRAGATPLACLSVPAPLRTTVDTAPRKTRCPRGAIPLAAVGVGRMGSPPRRSPSRGRTLLEGLPGCPRLLVSRMLPSCRPNASPDTFSYLKVSSRQCFSEENQLTFWRPLRSPSTNPRLLTVTSPSRASASRCLQDRHSLRRGSTTFRHAHSVHLMPPSFPYQNDCPTALSPLCLMFTLPPPFLLPF